MGVVLLREFLFDSFAIKKDVFYEKTSLLILHRAQNLPSLLLLSKIFVIIISMFCIWNVRLSESKSYLFHYRIHVKVLLVRTEAPAEDLMKQMTIGALALETMLKKTASAVSSLIQLS